jgi:hypothetical protein
MTMRSRFWGVSIGSYHFPVRRTKRAISCRSLVGTLTRSFVNSLTLYHSAANIKTGFPITYINLPVLVPECAGVWYTCGWNN